MVFVGSNFNELNLISLRYPTADVFQTLINFFSENNPSILRRADKTITFNFIDCTDADGNSYPVVEIGSESKGSQFWMAEDLKTTSYRNGDPIRTTTPATAPTLVQPTKSVLQLFRVVVVTAVEYSTKLGSPVPGGRQQSTVRKARGAVVWTIITVTY